MDRQHEDRILRWAAGVFAVAFVLHTADHLRRGLDSVTPQVSWLGNIAAVVAVVAIVIVLRGHRLAPLVAVSTGLPLAIGYAVVHMLPRWSEFSDSFPSGDVSPLSWAAASLEIVGALTFAAAGAYVLRRRGLHTMATSAA